MSFEKVEIGLATLYLGDCAEVLPTLGQVDAVVTDPPYGIDYDPSVHKTYSGDSNEFEKILNDDKELDFSFIFNMNCQKIIWGAENFYKQLPHRGRWICWHKRSDATKPNSMFSGDFELAWMDSKKGFYKYFQLVHGGVINADSVNGNNEKRVHPTQKPAKLMEWCINILQKDTALVCDPFMGSGTTGVAAVKMGRRFIGIEREAKYFEIAKQRIDAAQRQENLF